MAGYRRLFNYKPPFRTICEPNFILYLEKQGKKLSSELEDLLGGKVVLFSTPCINAAVYGRSEAYAYSDATTLQCRHAGKKIKGEQCMKQLVNCYRTHKIVVCTMIDRDRYPGHAIFHVPGLIVVTPTPDDRGGILITTDPEEAIVWHAKEKLGVISSGAKNMVVTKGKRKSAGKRDAEEIIEKQVVSSKKQKVVKGAVVQAIEKTKTETKTLKKNAKKQETPSEEDSSSSESEEEQKKGVAKKPAPDKKPESSSEDESDESSSEDEAPKKPVAAAKNGAAAAKKKDSSFESDSDDSSDEEEAKPAAKKPAPAAAKNGNTDVEMVDAPSAKKAPQTPATPQATGSKTIFMGNLSFSIEENDIVNFFKDVGEVAEVRFAMRDERFAGYGHVEFTTADAAQKALELNGSDLLGRDVKIDLAKERGERGSYTPGGNDRSSQRSGGQGQRQSVFVRGFGADDDFDSLRATLQGHFGGCGKIARLAIPKDYDTGAPKGFAFIDFADSNGFNKALELNGTEVGGGYITVLESKPRGDGASGGGGRFGYGGRSGDRSGGRFGSGRGRDGGRQRGRGPSRPSMAQPGTGKKTTFGDD